MKAYSLDAAMLVLCSGGACCLTLPQATVLYVDTTPAEPEYIIDASRLSASCIQDGWEHQSAQRLSGLWLRAVFTWQLSAASAAACCWTAPAWAVLCRGALWRGCRLSTLMPAHLHLVCKDLTGIELAYVSS